jgi:hypothetical protein
MKTSTITGIGIASSAAVNEAFHAITASYGRAAARSATSEHERSMAAPAALATNLAASSGDLNRSDVDVPGLLERLAVQVHGLVPSYAGLSVTTVVDDFPLTLTVMDESVNRGEIAASATLPLTITGAATLGQIVFYATGRGAFVNFAADASPLLLGMDLDAVLLDRRLSLPSSLADASGVIGLTDFSAINQACGVLIEQGHAPESAHAELLGIARDAGVSETATARRILAAVAR